VGRLPVVVVLELPRRMQEVALVDVRSGAGPILACSTSPARWGYLIEDGPPRREAGLLRGIEWSVRVPALRATESDTGNEGR
jgi:hypothetical protein